MTITKFRPILFSTPMVQAILENRKTMTRRTKGLEKYNEAPDEWRYDGISEEGDYAMELLDNGNPKEIYSEIFPAYNLGDVLWVRETCLPLKIVDVLDNEQILYKADQGAEDFIKGIHSKWKPSIFMPKHACRIFLKIKSIKVERLWDISKEDAISEGIEILGLGFKNYDNYVPLTAFDNTQSSFFSLWSKINGLKSLQENPFVFVYEFEQIEKPLDFS